MAKILPLTHTGSLTTRDALRYAVVAAYLVFMVAMFVRSIHRDETLQALERNQHQIQHAIGGANDL